MAKREKWEGVSDYTLAVNMGSLEEFESIETFLCTTNRHLRSFTRTAARQGQLNSATLVDRFSRRSISNGRQCAHCIVKN
jgi:hypothetical protein